MSIYSITGEQYRRSIADALICECCNCNEASDWFVNLETQQVYYGLTSEVEDSFVIPVCSLVSEETPRKPDWTGETELVESIQKMWAEYYEVTDSPGLLDIQIDWARNLDEFKADITALETAVYDNLLAQIPQDFEV